MPESVQGALYSAHLMDAYTARPPYQRNDYLMWIEKAVRTETKEKRIAQMLRELKQGNVYMNMRWSPK